MLLGFDLSWFVTAHDRTVASWVIVFAYALAAASAVRAYWRERPLARTPAGAGFAPGFWLVLALLLGLLGVNKQLDLQTLMTELGRSMARSEGWYANRRGYQVAVIVGLIGASVLVFGVIAFSVRRAFRRYLLALAGLWLLVIFVALRAASFHHLDAAWGSRIGGLKPIWLLELSAILVTLAGTLLPFRHLARHGAGPVA